MGLGRCKEHCNMDEKELDKMQRKCCIRSKVVQLIKTTYKMKCSTCLKRTQEVLKITKMLVS